MGEDGGDEDEDGEGGGLEGGDHWEGGGEERPVLAALSQRVITTYFSQSTDN